MRVLLSPAGHSFWILVLPKVGCRAGPRDNVSRLEGQAGPLFTSLLGLPELPLQTLIAGSMSHLLAQCLTPVNNSHEK